MNERNNTMQIRAFLSFQETQKKRRYREGVLHGCTVFVVCISFIFVPFTLQKREASYKLASDVTSKRKSNQNAISNNVDRDTELFYSFKRISKPKQLATFSFVAPKASNSKQTNSPVDNLKKTNSRHGLPRGVGSLNLRGADHGSQYRSRSTRPQTAGSPKLRRNRSNTLDSKNVSGTLPAKAPNIVRVSSDEARVRAFGTTFNSTYSNFINYCV